MHRLFRWCGEQRGRLAIGVGILASIPACGATHREADTVRLEGGEQSDAEVYMPLEDGAVYSYETTSTDGAPQGVFTIQVLHRTGNRVSLKVGGKTQSLQLGPDGIRFTSGGYLLKAPVQKGRVWQGESDGVQVVDVGERVHVPAGTFSGCIRTTEVGAQKVRTTTVYCPRVGMVSIDVEERTGVHRVARLKNHGPRIDVLPANEHGGSQD